MRPNQLLNLAALPCVALALLPAACGGQSAPAPRSAGGYTAPAEQPAPPPAQASEDSWFGGADSAAEAEGAPASPSAGASARDESRAMEPSPEPRDTRPGLGTSWGETRVSRITTSPFFRESPDSPLTLTRIFYNDLSGVRAMSGRGFVSADQAVTEVMGGALTVTLTDASGRPLDAAQTGGNTYVVGEHGERYEIHIKNHTEHRLEAVITVDGLDVIDGNEGSFTKRGYILNPFATVEIDGFRTSEDTVAAFRFGSVGQSYASKKGKGRNVGVIGVAFFEERGSDFRISPREVHRRHTADPFPGRFASPPGN